MFTSVNYGTERRQALINLLLVLLFAVACLNFFIDVDNGGSGDGITSIALLPAERSFKASSPSNFNTKSTGADVVTIKAGHLNGRLYLPDALRPSKYQLHSAIKSDQDNPQCCLIASAPNKPKRITCHGTCFLPRACNDKLYPFQSASEESFFNQLRNVTFEMSRAQWAKKLRWGVRH